MTRWHTITAIPHLRRSGRLSCGHRGQECGVAPCQVRDAYLVTGRLIELLAELVAVAVVDDSLEHLLAGGLERGCGIACGACRAEVYLAQEAGRQRIGGYGSAIVDGGRELVIELGEPQVQTTQGWPVLLVKLDLLYSSPL
jgi:hypothetical protein